MTDIRVHAVINRADCETAGALFDRVWGMTNMVPIEIIIATVHAGGYASLARMEDDVVGASWGFLGTHGRERTLHSHVTGVVAERGSLGVGEALKRHQWEWASDHGVDTITWTFDPLIRRNAYFNLVKLGAMVTEYHEDFYGAISDGLNRGEHTDRLVVRWDVAGCRGQQPTGRYVDSAAWAVPTPADVEALRLNDRGEANSWRTRQRADLRKVFSGGWKVAGFMVDGSYAVVRA